MSFSPVRFHQASAGFHLAAWIAFQVLGTASPFWGFACGLFAAGHLIRSAQLERQTEARR